MARDEVSSGDLEPVGGGQAAAHVTGQAFHADPGVLAASGEDRVEGFGDGTVDDDEQLIRGRVCPRTDSNERSSSSTDVPWYVVMRTVSEDGTSRS